MKKEINIPKDGIAGLKESFSADALSGFLVFLLAMPLSLGIAKASDFPAIYGLITAMIGGIVVSFLSGSALTIKGPAAGLIVIVAGAVAELGQGNTETGWHLALGAVVVAGVIQVLFGFMKLGSFSDFFPLSAVHGMLAAIGIIIISKQIHILAGVNPMTPEGKPMVEPMELLALIPSTLGSFFVHKEVVIIGLVSLAIVFGWPMLKIKALKKIPAPLIVLIVSIILAQVLGVHNIKADPEHGVKAFAPLVSFDKGLLDILGVNVSFEGFSQTGTFIKYVVMFALVGSLEALLTVKAVDLLDHHKRKSDSNKELIAVGAGNIIAGILGGLPMIAEVARSSANVANGAQTRWANFFHGIFILLFLLFAVTFSNLIPNAALAAMLIGVGFRLASPKEFKHMLHVGWEQLIIFIITIIVTLSTDLLVGILAGIAFKIIFEQIQGVPAKYIFKAELEERGDTLYIKGAAVFSNYISLRKKLDLIDKSRRYTIDFSGCTYVDHSVHQNIFMMTREFTNRGGHLEIKGLELLTPSTGSRHPEAALKQFIS